MMNTLHIAMGVALCVVAVSAVPAKATPVPTPPPGDFVTELTKRGNYTQILYLLQTAGLLETLLNATSMTLFLPTDAAIARVPAQTINDLTMNPQALVDLLSYHAVVGTAEKINRRDNDKVLMSVNNKPIRLNIYNRPIKEHAAEGIKVTDEDIQVANGYVHGIDGIMTPPEGSIVEIISKRPDLSILASLLTKAGLIDDANNDFNLTVFAPTNDAFAKLDQTVLDYLGNDTDALTQILKYHEVKQTTLYSIGMRNAQTFNSADKRHDKLMLLEEGDRTFINRAEITEKDISATNGVIHVIDKVLIPTNVLLTLENNNAIVG